MKKVVIEGKELEKMLIRIYESFKNKENLSLNDIELPSKIKSETMKAFKLLIKEYNEERKGKFIVISGVDKSGKETHSFNPHNLKNVTSVDEFLRKRGYKVLGIKQPSYETILGELVGAYLGRIKTGFSIKGSIRNKYAWILWSLDRAQHIGRIVKWLEKDEMNVVLSKRWTESHVIYQYFNGIPIKEILDFEKNVPKPDIIIVIDIPYSELVKRLNKTKKDNYEKISFLKKIRNAYLRLPFYYPYGETFLVSGKGSIEETNRRIITCLSEIFD